MRLVLSAAVALLPGLGLGAEAPLRFSIADSWTMPLVHIEDNQPTQGILYDMIQSLARQVGSPVEFHVIARLRLQAAMERGDVDVRCYAAQSWLPGLSGDYIWSLPLITQRDYLVARADNTTPVDPATLAPQNIGAVLGYSYPTLQGQFDKGQLLRDDARSQYQVLEKLRAGRYRYAISSQFSLNWFNQQQPPGQQLHSVAFLEEQRLGCYVRNDPKVPVQRILRTLLRMKMSGEIDQIIAHYTSATEPPPP
ncbi:substrate-binding periplasmic protein [Pseudomonas abieticivorans]|uniref:substrate-binding periplasmic protein n=1 Tax=Pseudomonas abieticivorans TaxID=2931382 RepID=UPI0020BF2601|nr:transporter substrate-binding domain-containing protein [Pseudomonas sp. PIA16]